MQFVFVKIKDIMKKTFNKLLILPFHIILKCYQYIISPILPRRCRFLPTCSNYSIEAYSKHGVIIGSWLTFKRIIRCHPFGQYGYDPVNHNQTNKQKF
ncbi:MAG: membrane protein insertion efficiency factor YidD [Alphaproteobacteria bacterium]